MRANGFLVHWNPFLMILKNDMDFLSEKFYLFGHSAGGGFVHRYLLFKKEAPVLKAVAANPAFVTLPIKTLFILLD